METGHGDREPAPLGLTEALLALQDGLESHMAKAEQVLFPMMRQGGHPMIAPPINVLRHEHASAAALLRELLHVTNDLSLREGACPSRSTPHTGLEKHSDDLVAPIHLENEVRLPRVKAA